MNSKEKGNTLLYITYHPVNILKFGLFHLNGTLFMPFIAFDLFVLQAVARYLEMK